ncbi:Zinc finger protein [Plakobranchus ocellatus]|uniref:Zinc finger protein n=1 Tax=Plakobranchus ocellatus TaxID=259542 RepID=A0AAV3ZLX0_9GAST|nr:Zinc finger protein [Plakobranchus ocellatus]
MEVTGKVQSEIKDGMLRLSSGEALPIMANCTALKNPKRIKDLLRGEKCGREVDVMRDAGFEGIVVRKGLIGKRQLTGARGTEDLGMSVMVGAVTTRAQALHEKVTRPLRMHGRVDHGRFVNFQREDPAKRVLVGARKTSRRWNKTASFEKIKGIVYRRFGDPGSNISMKKVVLTKSLLGYVMSMARKSVTGAHLGIRQTTTKKNKVLSIFYGSGVDGDVTRYCRSSDVCSPGFSKVRKNLTTRSC